MIGDTLLASSFPLGGGRLGWGLQPTRFVMIQFVLSTPTLTLPLTEGGKNAHFTIDHLCHH